MIWHRGGEWTPGQDTNVAFTAFIMLRISSFLAFT